MSVNSLANVPLKVHAAGATDIGRGRRHNEDAVLLRPDLNLFVLADGAGGHNAGNVASALATTAIAEYFESTAEQMAEAPDVDEFGLLTGERRIVSAIQHANRDIIAIAKTSNRHRGMGTTVVAVTVSPHAGLIHVAHVGDSRLYRLRDGRLEVLTRDHSLLHDVLELRPDMPAEALARLPRNVVTRALGMEDPVRVSVRSHEVASGDVYLLCSDGLTDVLAPEALADVLQLPKSPEDLVRVLIDLALAANSRDNVAALVLTCEMAPGRRSVLRRRAPAPSRPPGPPPLRRESGSEPEVTMESSPEIVIMGTEPDADPNRGSHPSVTVVPPGGPQDELLEALTGLVAPKESTDDQDRWDPSAPLVLTDD